jgi:hypothetical protein
MARPRPGKWVVKILRLCSGLETRLSYPRALGIRSGSQASRRYDYWGRISQANALFIMTTARRVSERAQRLVQSSAVMPNQPLQRMRRKRRAAERNR